MNNKKYRVVIIEPSIIISRGLKNILENHQNIILIENLKDSKSFFQKLLQLSPDIIILNPNIFGLNKRFKINSLFKEIGNFKLIGINYEFINEEIKSNFHGIIDIYDNPQKILNTILSSIEIERKSEKNEKSELSDREKEILISLAKGLQNKEIADKHNISIHTVISHRKNISKKTGIKSVSGLTIYALFNNLISKNEFI